MTNFARPKRWITQPAIKFTIRYFTNTNVFSDQGQEKQDKKSKTARCGSFVLTESQVGVLQTVKRVSKKLLRSVTPA